MTICRHGRDTEFWCPRCSKRGSRIGSAIIAVAVAIPVGLAGWALNAENNREIDAWNHRNQDPRVGPVLMVPNGQEWKNCDGSTLLYHTDGGRGSEGVSAVANSSECR